MIEAMNAMTRPLVTIALSGALIYLTVIGRIGGEQFFTVVTMVLGFWFGQRLQNGSGEKAAVTFPPAPVVPKGE
jgi:hypothetical protein